jgi:(2Fe-2S) ferredoxin
MQKLFKASLVQHGVGGSVRANRAGCLDQCEHGPVVVIYPEGTWYGNVTPADVNEIVREHIVYGRTVERLRLADECVNTSTCAHKPRC